jgi:pantothenate kinase
MQEMTTSRPVAVDAALASLLGRLTERRLLLGIAGPPGAGKSTLAARVVDAVPGAVLVPMDGFHLAQRVLDDLGLADRKGAPETFDRRGFAALLQRVREQRPGDGPVYAPDFRREIEEPVAGAIAVPADAPLVVTEGNYLLLWAEVHALLDRTWWVQVDDAQRRRRLVARHIAFGKPPAVATQWVERSDEANATLVAPGRGRADVVVTEDPA